MGCASSRQHLRSVDRDELDISWPVERAAPLPKMCPDCCQSFRQLYFFHTGSRNLSSEWYPYCTCLNVVDGEEDIAKVEPAYTRRSQSMSFNDFRLPRKLKHIRITSQDLGGGSFLRQVEDGLSSTSSFFPMSCEGGDDDDDSSETTTCQEDTDEKAHEEETTTTTTTTTTLQHDHAFGGPCLKIFGRLPFALLKDKKEGERYERGKIRRIFIPGTKIEQMI